MMWGYCVKNTGRAALRVVPATLVSIEMRFTHLLQCVSNLVYFCYISSVKWGIMILLYNVENRDGVTALEELFDYVSADETAATEDDIDLALLA